MMLEAQHDYICIVWGKAMAKPMEHLHEPLYDLTQDTEVHAVIREAGTALQSD